MTKKEAEMEPWDYLMAGKPLPEEMRLTDKEAKQALRVAEKKHGKAKRTTH